MLVALDTDVFTDVLYADPAVVARLAAVPVAEQVLPVVALEELIRGRFNVVRQAEAGRGRATLEEAYARFQLTVTSTRAFTILPYTVAADGLVRAWRAAKLRIGTRTSASPRSAFFTGPPWRPATPATTPRCPADLRRAELTEPEALMHDHAANQFCRRTRRELLWETGAGFGALGLTGLLHNDPLLASEGPKAVTAFANPMAPKPPMHPAKAKAVIFLFMYGGPSQVDTFDEKPKLAELDGKTIPVKTFGRGGHKNVGRVVGPKFAFKNYGKCGKRVSDLFPNVGQCVDDIAFIHSMYAESPIHGSGLLMMNSGRLLSGSPCLGAG
jgi:hypothetical protein